VQLPTISTSLNIGEMASTLVASVGAISLDTPSDHVTPQNFNTAVRNDSRSQRSATNASRTVILLTYRYNQMLPYLQLRCQIMLLLLNSNNTIRHDTHSQDHQWQSNHWAMFANLHDNVQNLLNESNLNFTFRNIDNESNKLKDRNTNIMGRFECTNIRWLSKGWFSNVIPITIRYYANHQYNARVYKQRCKRCDSLGERLRILKLVGSRIIECKILSASTA
jgi:hypothetical protein